MISGTIEYADPRVILMGESGLGVSEVAARMCYDSFDKSSNETVSSFGKAIKDGTDVSTTLIEDLRNLSDSALLHQLAWVNHHHSIVEHTVLTYAIIGTSRGVLQEYARHRIQGISVRSTRYTMSDILIAFLSVNQIAYSSLESTLDAFYKVIVALGVFNVKDTELLYMEVTHMYDKLNLLYKRLGASEFKDIALSKDAKEYLMDFIPENDDELETGISDIMSLKRKRNAGDVFKYIVTDNWCVNIVSTFNIRSLKNFFDLRDSGAAWFQIQILAKAMKEVTPVKYLKLIDKGFRDA